MNEITLGMGKWELDKKEIQFAAFHPTKDIWYVIACGKFLIFNQGVLASIEEDREKVTKLFQKVLQKGKI